MLFEINWNKINWKLILGIGIYIVLFWFFIPSQHNYYLERDTISFTLNETLIIIGVIFFISIIIFYRYLSLEKDKFIRIAQTFANSIFMGLVYFLWVQTLVVGLGLLTNRISEKEQITEQFEVTYVMNNGEVGIRSLEDRYFERTEDKFTESKLTKIKQGDTITIVFKKGLFGKKYIPSGKIKIDESEL